MKAVKFLNVGLLATALFGFPAVSLPNLAFAQTTTSGDIAGTVTDPSGAVIPNAPVTLTNDATGQTVNVTTNNSGYYRASSLQPGNYTITVTAQGFKAAPHRASVAVGQATTVNISTATAAETTTIDVTAEAPVIQTENANISTSHDTREIELLPNGGGDQTYIAQTSPGVNINTASGGGFGNFSAFGLPATSNLFTLNGNDNMDPYLNLNNSGATNLTLGANELAEVTVVDNAYSVNFGRQAGAQVNSVTKSGTNQFHGNAIYWWNGRTMNANNWFNKHVDLSQPGATIQPRGFVNANQWAASFGGPVVHDKTFFFLDTEGLRVVIPVNLQVFAPSPAFQQFVTGTSLPSAGQSAQVPYYQNLFNLFNNAKGANTATPVTDSQDPNLGCGDLGPTVLGGQPCAVGYRANVNNFAQEWTLAARVDQNIGNSDKAYLRYHMDKGVQPTYTDPINPLFNAQSPQPSYDGQLNETHTFGTKAVNQFILSGAYYRALFVNTNAAQANALSPASIIFADGLFGAPQTGLGLGGENFVFPQGRNVTQYQIVDDLTYNLGNHTAHFGVNFRRNDVTDYVTSVLTTPEQLIFSMTDFSQGISDFFTQRFPQRPNNPVALWNAGFYAQDDWRIGPKFKLNLGIRFDHNSNPVCQTNCFTQFAPGTFTRGTVTEDTPYNQVLATGKHQAFPSTQAILYQPRVGFSWQPFGNSTVLRGGYGIFFDLIPATLVDNFIRNAPGVVQITDQSGTFDFAPGTPNSVYSGVAASAAGFSSAFASGGTFNTIAPTVSGFAGPTLNTLGSKVKTPEFQEWNLELEQAIGSKNSVSVNYVGNHGIHIPMNNGWLNAACRSAASCDPALFSTLTRTRAFGNVNQLNFIGYSHYNGLVLSGQRKFSNGFQAQVSYTWSHATDTISNGGVLPFSNNDSALNQLSPLSPYALNYGNADYDVRHSVNLNYVYQVPFSFSNGFVNQVLGGWTLGGTLFFHTGYPFTVFDTADLQGGGGLRNASNTAVPALLLGTANFNACTSGPSINANNPGCLDVNNFGTVIPLTAGISNQRRNQFRGPGYFNTDMSLSKAFKLSERFRLTAGANFYNVLNHPNFGNPSGDISNGNFGQYFTTVNPPTSALGSGLGGDASARTIQLQAKITF